MTTVSRSAGASALIIAAALFYAPLAYGCTRPETLPPLFGLLGASILIGMVGILLGKRWPSIPKLVVICVAAILIQGWWMVSNPASILTELVDANPVDASASRIHDLAFNSMLATSFLLGSFVLFCDLMARAECRRFLLQTVAISGALISVIGIILKLTGPPVMRFFWKPLDIDWNDFAFYRYHGNAGAFLNLTWPIILVLTRRAYAPTVTFGKRLFWTFAAVGCAGAILLNASKAALIIGLLILPWPFSTWLMRLPGKKLVLLSIGATALLAAGLFASSRLAEEAAFERLTDDYGVSASIDGRWEAYEQYWDALPQVGLLGVGPGLFQIAFPYQQSPLGNITPGLREYAHEDYFQTVIEWGWLGSVWWFLLIAGGLYRAITSYRRRELFASKTDRHLVLGAILGVCGTLAQAVIDFPLQIASIRLFFLVLLAFCWASPELLTPSESETPSEESFRRNDRE